MTNETNDKRELVIAIPLHASEVAGDSANHSRGDEGRSRWPQRRALGITLAGNPRRSLSSRVPSDFVAHFRIRRGVYERFKSAPVSLRLVYAFDRASLVSYNTIPMPLTTVAVPGVGMCTPEMPWFQHPPEITGIACLSAMRQPDLTYITAHWSVEPCAANHEASASLIGTAWAGTLDASPAQFGIVSVWDVPIYLSNIWTGNPPRPRRICPGSPVTFARFARSGRGQVTLTIPAFHLPELALGDQYRMRIGN